MNGKQDVIGLTITLFIQNYIGMSLVATLYKIVLFLKLNFHTSIKLLLS